MADIELSKLYLFAVAHWAFASDHDFTAGNLLDLFGRHASRTKYPTDEVELQYSKAVLWPCLFCCWKL